MSELRERGIAADTLSRLAARGLVELFGAKRDERIPFDAAVTPATSLRRSARVLTAEQTEALETLAAQCDRRTLSRRACCAA